MAAYKQRLRDYLDRRPSGARLRIARVLGTHKSFVSQITNPADPTPVPARHLNAIFDICQLSQSEREDFLALYAAAHPEHVSGVAAGRPGYVKTLHVDVPVLADADRQRDLEELIRDFARRAAALARGKDD
ncbi:hypothetical protein CKO28_21700 [Rhodovibrio sodomensis]|uniref:Transcriptional regulator n=1 Tax=Rhodovibrio sodomensis TaxID=1088 RepID=A0ABS1DMP0_9PROT|nr:hypothetical protein [Rhodovibrio sodomensis]MBK1670640.1 hypothetical protein [Rhodovibrio sodomensis]